MDVWLGVHESDAPAENWNQLVHKPCTGPPCPFVEKWPRGSKHLQTAYSTKSL